MDTKTSLRRRSAQDLALRVSTCKRTLRQWFYYVCLKFLQENNLTEAQETFFEKVTDYFITSMSRIESDEMFREGVELKPISIPKKDNLK